MYKGKTVNRTVTPKELVMVFSGSLAKFPAIDDERFFYTTRELAELFRVTPQRITQYVLDEGLPKSGRDRFYLPDAMNWDNVKYFASLLHRKPQEMRDFLFVDFTLGVDPPIFVKMDSWSRPTRKTLKK